jgi:serine protease inhibitor
MKLVTSLILGLAALGQAKKKNRSKETTPKFATAKLALNVDKWVAETKPNSNSIYSPVSLYNILASVYFGTGATSETRKELQEKFNFKPTFKPEKYAQKLGDMTRNKALETFNSYIFHKGTVKKDYAEELKMLNFKDEKFQTFVGKEGKINKIVADDTNNMIKNMFTPGSFDGTTSLVLLNTILFTGKWDERFGEFKEKDTRVTNTWWMGTEETSPGPFAAEFMRSKKRKLRAYSKDRINYISLRFKGEGGKPTWMTIVMPNVGSTKAVHEVDFNEIDWNLFQRKESTLVMPKFNIDNELDLVDFMKAQGAERLFSPETADLDRMFGKNTGNYVGKFKQKATIKVHERGAEAAAATSIEMIMKSMPRTQRTYNIKRPFKFFIHSLKSDKEIKLAKQRKDKFGAEQQGDLYFSGVVNCPMNNCG